MADENPIIPEPVPEPETPIVAAAEIDYDRIISGVTDTVSAVMEQRLKAAPKAQEVAKTPEDPLAGITGLLDVGSSDYNPQEAERRLQVAISNGQKVAVEQAMASVAPLLQSQGMAKLTQGLTDEGKEFAVKFMQEKGINPALLNDPVIEELVRSRAELHQMNSLAAQKKEIPATEGVKPIVANIDADTNRQLTGLQGLYESLGLKFDAAKLIQRAS